MNKYFFLITCFSISAYAGRHEICSKVSPVMIEPQISSQIKFDKKTQNYTYGYKVTNLGKAMAPIRRIGIESIGSLVSIKSPKGWDDPEFDNDDGEILFTTLFHNLIKPGQSLDGFEIVSKSPPGLVQVYMEGDTNVDDLPTIKYDTDEEARKGDDETIACPGWYRGGGLHGDHVALVTTGPLVTNRIEAKIRFKRIKEKKWHGNHQDEPDIEISPLENGKIQVMLFGDKNIDVTKVNLSTLEFGRGKAKPIKTQIIGEFKADEDVDDEIKKYNKENKSVKHLLMEFNLTDVDVKCDIDRSLFLAGKIGTQDLFGAAKIKHVGCNKKTFSKEAKKIRGDGGSH